MWRKQTYPASTKYGKASFSIGCIVLGLSGLLLTSCNSQNLSQAERENVTSKEVAGDTSALVGQEITIRNTVTKTIGDESFTVEAEGGEPILVVNATGQPFQIPDSNVPIQTTGTVEQFSVDTIGQRYGITLDRELYSDYEGQPAIIAKSLALAPNPQNFYEADWANDVGVLVIGVKPYLQGKSLEEGENVVVTGQAQPATEQLLRDANLGWSNDQLQEFISRYTNRPVVVADGVYPSAVGPAPGLRN